MITMEQHLYNLIKQLEEKTDRLNEFELEVKEYSGLITELKNEINDITLDIVEVKNILINKGEKEQKE